MPDFKRFHIASPSFENSGRTQGFPRSTGLARKKRHPVSADSVPFFGDELTLRRRRGLLGLFLTDWL